jgi:hypothetical protein
MTVCKHGFIGTEEISEYTGALLGVSITDESHADMYGSYFCACD